MALNDVTSFQAEMKFRFLGGCEILYSDERVRLETAKTRALLIYLLMNPGPQERHKLMGLLWGDLPEPNARRNLRRALWNLRRQLTHPDFPPLILADRDTVAINHQSPYRLDVKTFQDTCSTLDQISLNPASSLDINDLSSGVELYRGEFLDGFFVSGAPAFEDWALVERERLRTMVLNAFQKLIEGYETQNEHESALIYARQSLTIEPWREETHRQIMHLLALTGQRAAALVQFETCSRLLAEELEVEPSEETQVLYEQIKTGLLTVPPLNLPAQTTPFVGREKELKEISRLLEDPDCRLLTLTGLGGTGKTRLALQSAAKKSGRFSQGVFFVPLATISSAQLIITAITSALKFTLFGGEDPKTQLLNFLREKQLLLVLDNFEHLLGGLALLTEILANSHQVKILVTSRQRLNLQGEWVFELEGLDIPPDETVDNLEDFGSVQLFLQTARRVRLDFTLSEREKPYLVRICRKVMGLPLAIELAAAWVRVLSPEEIADEIERQLDILEAPQHARTDRHRSMRGVFEHSWNLLSEEERLSLQKLSVFRSDFRREAAQQVAGASLLILSALVDKSFLRRTPNGRYQMHELLKQYVVGELERIPHVQVNAHDAHCDYMAASLQRYADVFDKAETRSTLSALDEISTEMEDIREAWRWAIAQKKLKAIGNMYYVIFVHCHITTAFREGETFFREALEGLGWSEGDDIRVNGDDFLPWMLFNRQAAFSVYLGRIHQAHKNLHQCLATLRHLEAHEETALCLFFLGEATRFLGNNEDARQLLRESLTKYREIGDMGGAGFCLNVLGVVSRVLEDNMLARKYLEESLAVFKQTNHLWGQAISSINLADLLKELREYQVASEILAENITLCEKLGHRWGKATCLNHLGDIVRAQGRIDDAQMYYRESLAILEDIGQRQGIVGLLTNLGTVKVMLGEYEEARKLFLKAIRTAAEIQSIPSVLDAAVGFAEVLLRQREVEQAGEILISVENHPLGGKETKERAQNLFAELKPQISPGQLGSVRERSQGKPIEDLLARYM